MGGPPLFETYTGGSSIGRCAHSSGNINPLLWRHCLLLFYVLATSKVISGRDGNIAQLPVYYRQSQQVGGQMKSSDPHLHLHLSSSAS